MISYDMWKEESEVNKTSGGVGRHTKRPLKNITSNDTQTFFGSKKINNSNISSSKANIQQRNDAKHDEFPAKNDRLASVIIKHDDRRTQK